MKHDRLSKPAAAAAILLAQACRSGPRDTAAAPPQIEPPVASTAAPAATTPDAPALESPYRRKPHMYRGQLHAHTTNSDGHQSPAAVVAAYKRAGYGFVAITDHDHNTPDPGVPGILFVPGVENDHTCLHENRINATTVAPGARLSQDVIDQANREGSFVQINHPDWPGRYPQNPCWSDAALLAVHGYDAVEAWNSSNDAWNSNAERRIDFLLSNGRRTFLTAVDDCHDVTAGYCMTASVNVFADAPTLADVMANLKAGNFYASAGAEIASIDVEGRTVRVETPKRGTIEFVSDGGKVAQASRDALSASHEVAASESYVRIRVTRAADGRMAWSNPIYPKK